MEILKKCIKCGEKMPLTEFYYHARMADSHLNKCKMCVREAAKKQYDAITSTPEGLLLERKRHREKYYRLNYKEKHKPTVEAKKETIKRYKEKYPEKYIAKNATQHIPTISGQEKHHWSYNLEHWKDIIFLTTKEHMAAHRYIIYDQERMMYRALDGMLLDTKEAHYNYIKEKAL